MANESSPPTVELRYRIASCTGHSGKYVPEHILVNAPTDQSSRWSGAHQTTNSRQWIILELTQPSLLQNITFGKFHKTHPCNMKEFKVYTGRTLETLCLTRHGSLSNDPTSETFNLQSPNEAGLLCPVRFIKIVPLSAHSPSFHTSIWHISISGINDETFVKHAEDAYASYRETSALRHVLKFLRQRRHFSSFRALQSRTGIMLEHPIVAKIYDNMMSGDWSFVESLIETAANDALFDGYIQACDPKALWRRLNGANPDGDVPSPRGGHQMCVDSEAGLVYLFGGWDGEKNLDDFWVYSVSEGRWNMLSSSTAIDNGPGPRSCHKMVFDPLLGYIYLLGRVLDSEGPSSPSPADAATPAHPAQAQNNPPAPTEVDGDPAAHGEPGASAAESGSRRFPSDFYRYTTRGPNAGKWAVLSEDTALEDGPPLIHDHQMEIDPENQILYVFGGRVINEDLNSGTVKFSGLYQYNIATGKWGQIFDDSDSSKTGRTIRARSGHSMVFDPRSQRLFILAGKRSESFIPDMYIYDASSQEVTEVTSDFSTSGGPDPCVFQRTAVDPESGHIYVLPGLLKSKGQKPSSVDGTLRSTFWIYRHESMRWTQVSNARAQAPDAAWDSSVEDELEPQPRYAHQMVYDSARKEFFVHGGNSGKDDNKRLDDFWSMRFERPSREEMVRRANFITRRQHFKELCETVPPVQALTFLQRDVHAVVDHYSVEETATFRALHSYLFDPVSSSFHSDSKSLPDEDVEMGNAVNADASPSGSEQKFGGRRAMPAISELQKDNVEGDAHPDLTPERFRQRTCVFESLLKLINADAKQPTTDLVDLVDGPDRELIGL